MEGLILLFGEALLGVCAAFLASLLSLVAMGISVCSALIRALIDSIPGCAKEVKKAKKRNTASKSAARPRVWGIVRSLGYLLGAVTTLAIAALAIIQWFFFEPAVEWFAKRVGISTGHRISWDAIDGNLFLGKFEFRGVQVTTIGSEVADSLRLETKADHFSFDIDMTSLLFEYVSIENLTVRGAAATIGLPAQHEPKRYHEKRKFRLIDTDIRDVHLIWNQPDRSVIDLQVETFRSPMLKSDTAVFDGLFRSNLSATLNGGFLSIKTSENSNGMGQTTEWHMEEIPVALVSDLIGGPFRLLRSGSLECLVYDEWEIGGVPEIDMDWQFILHDVRAEVPFTLQTARPVAQSFVDYVNQAAEDGSVEIQFDLLMNRDRFTGQSSLHAAGLWQAVSRAFFKHLAEQTGNDPSDYEERANEIIDISKSYFDRLRKADDP